jgi:stage V sporulation protein M
MIREHKRRLTEDRRVRLVRRDSMKFYTIKLPRFLGGLVRAMIGAFKKNE